MNQKIDTQIMHKPIQLEDELQEGIITPSMSLNKQNSVMEILNMDNDNIDSFTEATKEANFGKDITDTRNLEHWESRVMILYTSAETQTIDHQASL